MIYKKNCKFSPVCGSVLETVLDRETFTGQSQ